MFVGQNGSQLHNIDRCGIIIARGKSEQHDNLFFVVLAAYRYGVVEIAFQSGYVRCVDEQAFGNFLVASVQIARFERINGRNRATFFFRNLTEYRIPQPQFSQLSQNEGLPSCQLVSFCKSTSASKS